MPVASTKPARLLALDQHNGVEAACLPVERLRQGQRVAYASDAGTPAINDWGTLGGCGVCRRTRLGVGTLAQQIDRDSEHRA